MVISKRRESKHRFPINLTTILQKNRVTKKIIKTAIHNKSIIKKIANKTLRKLTLEKCLDYID